MRDGAMANAQFTNYIVPTTLDTPPMDVVIMERPYAHGPHGAKGVGEIGHHGVRAQGRQFRRPAGIARECFHPQARPARLARNRRAHIAATNDHQTFAVEGFHVLWEPLMYTNRR